LFLRGAVVGLVLTLAACAQKSAPPPRPITILPSAVAALTPALYMQLASSTALFAVRASELAQDRALDGGLRADARRIAQDQGGVGAQLSFAGRRIDLLPRAALPEPMEADLARLAQSNDFDRDYRQLVGQALARALEAHETYARAGSSPTLRPVAQMAAPATRGNLDLVRRR
jgi:putative membrane protein